MFDEEQRDTQRTLIKAATIHKLVERLTYHEYAGWPASHQCLWTHTRTHNVAMLTSQVHPPNITSEGSLELV